MDPKIQQILDNAGAGSPNIASPGAANPAIQSILESAGVVAKPPDDVAAALSDKGDQSYNGMCQAFVEQETQGRAGIYGSAGEAYNDQLQKGNVIGDTNKMHPGDVVYFSPNESNEGFGHTGIYMGDGSFVSATDNGVMPYNMKQWMNDTGQQFLGFSPGGIYK